MRAQLAAAGLLVAAALSPAARADHAVNYAYAGSIEVVLEFGRHTVDVYYDGFVPPVSDWACAVVHDWNPAALGGARITIACTPPPPPPGFDANGCGALGAVVVASGVDSTRLREFVAETQCGDGHARAATRAPGAHVGVARSPLAARFPWTCTASVVITDYQLGQPVSFRCTLNA